MFQGTRIVTRSSLGNRAGWRSVIGLFACLCLTGCGTSSPTAPTTSSTVSSGPRILLAGNSNAYFVAPFLHPVIDQSNIDGPIDYWLSGAEFARAAVEPLFAFVWWGSRDVDVTVDAHARKLRALIAVSRTTHAGLPVRIVEVPDRPDLPERALIKAAHREVATDPGVELIPTADLECADAACHLTQAGYATVRDRIYRSLGR